MGAIAIVGLTAMSFAVGAIPATYFTLAVGGAIVVFACGFGLATFSPGITARRAAASRVRAKAAQQHERVALPSPVLSQSRTAQ
jgi:hypothetical protein